MSVTTHEWQILGMMGGVALFMWSFVIYVEVVARRHHRRRHHATR